MEILKDEKVNYCFSVQQKEAEKQQQQQMPKIPSGYNSAFEPPPQQQQQQLRREGGVPGQQVRRVSKSFKIYRYLYSIWDRPDFCRIGNPLFISNIFYAPGPTVILWEVSFLGNSNSNKSDPGFIRFIR